MKIPVSKNKLTQGLLQYVRSRMLRKLVLMMVLIGLLPSLLIYGTMYSISYNLIQSEIQRNSQDSLQRIHNNISDILEGAEHVSIGLSIDDNFTAWLAEDDLAVGSLNRNNLRSLIESNLKTNRSVLNAIHIETPQNTVYVYNVADPVSPYAIRIFGSEYEDEVLRKRGVLYWFDMVDNTFPEDLRESRDAYIRCATAVYDTSGKDCLGIISMFIRISALENCLADPMGADAREMTLLMDSENRIIAASGEISPEMETALWEADLRQTRESIHLDGTDYLLSMEACTVTGWHLVNLIPSYTVARELHPSSILLLPLILIPIVCVIMAVVFVRWLLQIFAPLLNTMQEIQQGDLTVRAPAVEDSALDIIGHTLNQTLDKYHDLVVFTGHQEALLTISRLKFLRSQLSPHFLYNTLDSVNWMLLEAQQYETSQIISDLGVILRYSIDETSDVVPLREEIRIVERYLSIVRNRFENRLNCEITVEAGLEDYTIPRFLLQPIVENAVVHGVERTAANSTLSIRCYRKESVVLIDIANDGPSIPPETKHQIFDSFQEPEEASTHIGLRNVYKRIQLRYGSDSGLELLDMAPRGTIVRLRLPENRQGKEE